MGVSKYFNVINQPKLLEDLEEDPFINHALTSVCCELFYKYGLHLAPFTAMLTTAKHINFNKNKNAKDKNDGEHAISSLNRVLFLLILLNKLEAAQAAWSKKRMQRLDFVNEQIQKEHHAEQTFDNVNQAMKQYYYITGKQLDPLPPEPK